MADESGPDLRQQLSAVETQIAEQRNMVDEVRAQTGADAGPQDSEDIAALLTNIEELEGIINGLEQRRAGLLSKLGDDG